MATLISTQRASSRWPATWRRTASTASASGSAAAGRAFTGPAGCQRRLTPTVRLADSEDDAACNGVRAGARRRPHGPRARPGREGRLARATQIAVLAYGRQNCLICAATLPGRHNACMAYAQRSHFLDTLPFDWARPEARELRDFLASTFFREGPVVEFAVQAGVSPATVAWSQPMQSVWHELITKARNQGRLRELLGQVAASGDGVAARLGELTADAPVVEAPADTSQPTWLGFGDRGEMERQIFDEPTLLDVAFLQRGVELAPAVARLLVTLPGGRYYGTAFRIGEDLLLTNHHVLFDAAGARATAVEAWLRYELDVTGRPREHQVIGCRADTIIGDRVHDWAVIRVDVPPAPGVPILDLAGAQSVATGDRVYIIQHPNGGMKKVGMHHNVVRYADEDVIQYWTDTEPGSSGSPVFNERWELVALHHRWLEAGPPGAREYRNQGRRITRVTACLKAAGLM